MINSIEIKEFCKQIIDEAKAIIDYTDSIDAVTEEKIKNIFEEVRCDELGHLQKHTVALTEIMSGEEPTEAERMDGKKRRGDKRIIIDCWDKENSFQSLFEYIRDNSSSGHSFPVIVDEGDAERERKFYIDGDGSDRIVCIEIEENSEERGENE